MRIIWSLVVFSFMSILFLAAGTVTCRMFGRRQEIYSGLTTVTNDSLDLPDIHICDASFFRRQRLLGKAKIVSVLILSSFSLIFVSLPE